MKKDTNKTRTAFLYNAETEDLFAYFPDEIESNNRRLCYSQIGQHSMCSLAYVANCTNAEPEQYKDLAKELEGLGYNLEIINEL